MVPNIDYSLCQGCGGCAEAFPRFFEMRGERAWIINAGQFDQALRADPGLRDAFLHVCPYYAISIE